jgi:putative ABC transport system ATP-binding protein
MKSISKKYISGSNTVEALKKIDLVIAPGEFVGIMGPSGSGKSTLLHIMGCLDTQSEGVYQLKGQELNGMGSSFKSNIRNKVFGFVFQSFQLLPELTVAANVALPLKYSKTPKKQYTSMVIESLKTVGIEELADRYPDQLSGGQQQRVAIARALVNHPDVILADEPTGNLDSFTGQSIMEELKNLNKNLGTTIIVITHDARIAGYADRLIRLEDGFISEDMSLDHQSLTGNRVKNPFSDPYEEEDNEEVL